MSMSRSLQKRSFVWRLFAGLVLAVTSVSALAEDFEAKYNFQTPVTSTAREILDLHNLIFMIVTAIMLLVMGVMFYSIIAHRKSSGRKPATFSHSNTLEVVWTVIPFLILVGMATPATKALLKMDDTSGSDMTVKITGYQWKWRYEYPEQGIDFFSTLSTPNDQIENKAPKTKTYLREVDNELVLPVGKKIRLILTANDVIHAWWVPQLATKKDAIPGFINEMWTKIDEPGVYRGQCAELCGKGHGFMPIVVRAVTEGEFKQWANKTKGAQLAAAAGSDKTFTKAELMAKGEQIFAKVCSACHGVSGVSAAPAVFPSMKGSKVANGPLAAHLDIVMNGSKRNPAMTSYKVQLNDVDLAAIITYERNAFGNNGGKGDVVQPKQIKALR
jgi:cytochrome c oxidase subunit 2